MSMTEQHSIRDTTGHTGDSYLWRLLQWWWRHDEFGGLDTHWLERIAQDCGMTSRELKDLAVRGPHAADLLYRRMEALGLTVADVDRLTHGLMGSLERTCTLCSAKTECSRGLAGQPDDGAWAGYCPNAEALMSVMTDHP